MVRPQSQKSWSSRKTKPTVQGADPEADSAGVQNRSVQEADHVKSNGGGAGEVNPEAGAKGSGGVKTVLAAGKAEGSGDRAGSEADHAVGSGGSNRAGPEADHSEGSGGGDFIQGTDRKASGATGFRKQSTTMKRSSQWPGKWLEKARWFRPI